MRWFPLVLALTPLPAGAEAVVALRTLPARSVIAAADLTVVDAEIEGALSDISAAVGLELRTTLFAGRPLRREDLVQAALVERNQSVTLVFAAGGLSIAVEGRALDRGAEGEAIRVMNLASRTTLTGRVAPDGRIIVGD